MHINILSGSVRHTVLTEELLKDGHSVNQYKSFGELPETICGDITVLPIPTFNANGKFNLNGSPDYMVREKVYELIDKSCLLITCNAESQTHRCIDINQYEPFVSLNAIPSAEGAISIAMQNCDKTLFNSKTVVIGFGRIGKILASRLSAFGSRVTVIARNSKDRFLAEALGIKAVDFNRLQNEVEAADIIFQTVPHLVLRREILSCINNGLIIELSSGCAGTDIEAVNRIGNKMLYAPAIPEKYSPHSAGLILYDSVNSIINKIQFEEFT